MVSTSVLRNESAWTLSNGSGQSSSFIKIGERGNRGQSSTVGIDRNNVQFYTLVQQNAVGCWNSDEPYFQDSIDIVAQDNTTLVFPNDLKIDREIDQVRMLYIKKGRKKGRISPHFAFCISGCMGIKQSFTSFSVLSTRFYRHKFPYPASQHT